MLHPCRHATALRSQVASFKKRGVATFHPSGARDGTGEWLWGGETCKLHAWADVPVRGFRAAIAYELDRAAWIQHQPNARGASSSPDLQVNDLEKLEQPDSGSRPWSL